jgi:UDP-glucuronate 4-epimerase
VDICNLNALEKVFQKHKFDVVVHLAAKAGVRTSIKYPKKYLDVNVRGTLNLLKLAVDCGVSKFIFGSSSSVYGNQKKLPFSETDSCGFPISPYAVSKRSAELLCYTYHHLYRLPVMILRFFTVYGPRNRPDMAIYQFVEALFQNKPIIQFGEGNSSRDYTYIDDIIRGIIKAIEYSPLKFEIINLGSSHPIKLNQVIATLEKLTGKKANIKKLPPQPGDVMITFANIKKAKSLLAWQPKVSFEEGLKNFINWYRKKRPNQS